MWIGVLRVEFVEERRRVIFFLKILMSLLWLQLELKALFFKEYYEKKNLKIHKFDIVSHNKNHGESCDNISRRKQRFIAPPTVVVCRCTASTNKALFHFVHGWKMMEDRGEKRRWRLNTCSANKTIYRFEIAFDIFFIIGSEWQLLFMIKMPRFDRWRKKREWLHSYRYAFVLYERMNEHWLYDS